MTDAASDDRWNRISALYGQALHRSSDLRFQTFQLARVIGDRVLESLKCRRDAVSYYAYTVSEMPLDGTRSKRSIILSTQF